ncbi:RES family NAD+ phosphorylase [Ancylobacter dichloromethanicus]|uniref:RES domain-containing protein n=1 Tax=Ancylobacter dichloromethanicus TaxID=518825 RepID=A0A9W6J698_9HYPH|nr:RES family NAD+ phosphorylase [Ancylobacter dichloromethanicus]MBS7555961.1 RES family NAD+ phosphorylase [Ancylobacter dichloromethanicus]GLK70184.1 hypothetical protein GCM10017643_02990 [Ancylobacter dichloromethanicus]
MAKSPGKPKHAKAKAPGNATPSPPADLGAKTSTVIWPKGQIIHRMHLNAYVGDQFNPGLKGNARFSPIVDGAGAAIPTLYGGTTFDCAAMETVFHDVPFTSGLKTYDKGKLTGQTYSRLEPQQDLILADLSATALRRFGIRRTELIDTEKDRYRHTRLWAEAFYAARPDIQGLCWVSRQDDRALAIILFGNRLSAGALVTVSPSLDLIGTPGVYTDLISLAERIGVKVVPGSS